MAQRVQRVRDTESGSDQFTGLEGELTVDLTKKTVRVHDGSTLGGTSLGREDLTTSPDATTGNPGRMSAAQAGQLVDHETRLDAIDDVQIPALQAQINNNDTDIGQNQTDIATNTADIATNTADIDDLETGQGQFVVATGSSTAYSITLSPAPTSLTAGLTVRWRPNVACGLTPTLNVNGFGNIPLVTRDDVSLRSAMLQPENLVTSTYDGTVWFIPELSDAFWDPSALGGIGEFSIKSEDTSANTGPEFVIYRDRGNQLDDQDAGQIRFNANSSTGVERTYCRVKGRVLDSANGNEDGLFSVTTLNNGSETERFVVDNDEVVLPNSTPLRLDGGDIILDGGDIIMDLANDVRFITGAGDPEGVVTAGRGSIYTNQTGTGETNILYVKRTSGVATGWIRFDSTIPA